MTEKREWRSIRIEYMDGSYENIYKEDLDRVEGITAVIEALSRAKALKDKLEAILK